MTRVIPIPHRARKVWVVNLNGPEVLVFARTKVALRAYDDPLNPPRQITLIPVRKIK